MTNVRGTALFNKSNTPATISTMLISGKKILVLAMAPKKAPASGPTSGMDTSCNKPFSPKNSKNIPKIIRSTVFKFFIFDAFIYLQYKDEVVNQKKMVLSRGKMVLSRNDEFCSIFFWCHIGHFLEELCEIRIVFKPQFIGNFGNIFIGIDQLPFTFDQQSA